MRKIADTFSLWMWYTHIVEKAQASGHSRGNEPHGCFLFGGCAWGMPSDSILRNKVSKIADDIWRLMWYTHIVKKARANEHPRGNEPQGCFLSGGLHVRDAADTILWKIKCPKSRTTYVRGRWVATFCLKSLTSGFLASGIRIMCSGNERRKKRGRLLGVDVV